MPIFKKRTPEMRRRLLEHQKAQFKTRREAILEQLKRESDLVRNINKEITNEYASLLNPREKQLRELLEERKDSYATLRSAERMLLDSRIQRPGKTTTERINQRFERFLQDEKTMTPKIKSVNPYSLNSTLYLLGRMLSSSKYAPGVILEIAKLSSRISDAVLNSAIIFWGFEGRTREAILELILTYAKNQDPLFRVATYKALCFFNILNLHEFLFKTITIDPKGTSGIIDALYLLYKQKRLDLKTLLNGIELNLKSSNTTVRLNLLMLLLQLNNPEAEKMFLNHIAIEKDVDIITTTTINRSLNLSSKEAIEKITKSIRTVISLGTEQEIFNYLQNNLFLSLIPVISDMSILIQNLSKIEIQKIITIFEKNKKPLMMIHTLIGFLYFKAGFENKLRKVTILNKTFDYFLFSDTDISTESAGHVNSFACGVRDTVPKELQPIIAYHEYVEGQTKSHKKAVEEEIKAVKALGLQKEYVEWARKQLPKKKGARFRY